ncbi:HdeD family acid-resistance protein [Demequina sp. NBRC 110055]|uniref:HdeD family acid-resistance protein n=1 Tax=Demequina sp. NBRC 110055 TaxID=1570344 RepID=UPI000A003963|nr:DUF308 domain-containing protein [Demequina sp. NBRC 110055]
MTQQQFPRSPFDGLEIDPEKMARSAVNAARTMLGVLGALGVIIGIAMLVWPGKSLVVAATFAGIFFVITGVVRTSIGIFTRDVSSGFRLLNIILGLFLLLGGIVALKNLTAAAEVLTVITVVLIGMGWLIEGVATLAQAGRGKTSGMGYVRGAISIIAGLVVIIVPAWSALALVVMMGVTLVLIGIVGLMQAFALGKNLPPVGEQHTTIDG